MDNRGRMFVLVIFPFIFWMEKKVDYCISTIGSDDYCKADDDAWMPCQSNCIGSEVDNNTSKP